MNFLRDLKDNVRTVMWSAPYFIQILATLKILWWGIGTLAGVHFYIDVVDPYFHIWFGCAMIVLALVGMAGILFSKCALNMIFGYVATFLFVYIALNFLYAVSETLSAGTYIIDTCIMVWYVFRMHSDKIKRKAYFQ